MPQGQVSVELMVSFVFLGIFFVFSLWLGGEINSSAWTLQERSAEWKECLTISSLVQETFVQGPGTQVKTVSSLPFSVSSRTVYLPALSCDFSAAAEQASLVAGNLVIFNSNGIVVLQNE